MINLYEFPAQEGRLTEGQEKEMKCEGSSEGSEGSSPLLAHPLLLPQSKARLGRTSPGDDAESKM